MSVKLKDQSCSTCRFWGYGGTSEDLRPCRAPLPVSLSGWLVKLKPTFSTDGWDCKSYRKRINRRKKATVTQIKGVV
jgi:hypothetical protein